MNHAVKRSSDVWQCRTWVGRHGRFIISLALAVAVNVLLLWFVHAMVRYNPAQTQLISASRLVSFLHSPSPLPADTPSAAAPEMSAAGTESAEPSDRPPLPRLPVPEPSRIPEPTGIEYPDPAVLIPLKLASRPTLEKAMEAKAAKQAASPAAAAYSPNNALVPLYRETPNYPRRAKRSGVEGVVTVAFTVTTVGSVRDPKIVKSSPPYVFDRAVLGAIEKWRFNPRTEEVRAVQDITFTLSER